MATVEQMKIELREEIERARSLSDKLDDLIASDAISIAAQLGRLDFLNATLASIAIALVLGGVFSFLNFRSIARKTAIREAQRQATHVAENVTNEYMQKNLAPIVETYASFYDDGLTDDTAEGFSTAQ